MELESRNGGRNERRRTTPYPYSPRSENPTRTMSHSVRQAQGHQARGGGAVDRRAAGRQMGRAREWCLSRGVSLSARNLNRHARRAAYCCGAAATAAREAEERREQRDGMQKSERAEARMSKCGVSPHPTNPTPCCLELKNDVIDYWKCATAALRLRSIGTRNADEGEKWPEECSRLRERNIHRLGGSRGPWKNSPRTVRMAKQNGPSEQQENVPKKGNQKGRQSKRERNELVVGKGTGLVHQWGISAAPAGRDERKKPMELDLHGAIAPPRDHLLKERLMVAREAKRPSIK
ncbi:hypothetical protein B0H14DRAFT_2565457 [Mycena olivaceomarginata]|nr:hypothetical protein B0H14DRAFT_2565457 [Mycena olivaceomarginata]